MRGLRLLRECQENWVKTWEWAAKVVPGGKSDRIGGVSIIRAGIPGFNMAFAFDRPSSHLSISEAVGRIYSDSMIPWSLVTTPDTSKSFMPLIREMGLNYSESLSGMLLDPLTDSSPTLPRGLEIRRVFEPKEMHTLIRTGDMAFGIPAESREALADGLVSGIREGSFRGGCYLGYVDRKPVATSVRFTFSRMAGVYLVGTLPRFRSRGIGEAMTWRAAVDGREEGCIASTLQATEIGRQVYHKMGYKPIVEYQLWKKTPSKVPAGP